MISKEFRKSEAISYGWEAMKRNLGFFILFQLVIMILYAFLYWIVNSADRGGLPFVFAGPLRLAIMFSVTMLWVWTAMRVHDAKAHDHAGLFSSGRRILNYLAVELLYGLIVAAGFILLIVPAFIWGIQFGYARFAVLDEGLGPIEALRRSSDLTQGGRGNLFLFGLILAAINFLGAMAIGLGLLITVPTTWVAMAWAYRELQQSTAQSNSMRSASSRMV